ncbi:hypothetical protein KP003_07455 [Geomonas nitrogeniifigens]|uniref:contractile injection system tape measure protein n=1 Tax=Geomonas diazotrophica TaxID=2843197 RepID=UPI001C2BBCAF|nr:contractile injection system tape measure protein [Geomonas nitrogeniifigens]QXE88230.1 hypothetical protein KP003_07455 [Geomonas nitrogeniifigens]
MRHVIQKSHLHVEFDGAESEAAGLQRRLQRFCYDYLLPVMEVTLNEEVPEDEHFFLEELVIDAGTIPVDRLEADLPHSVQEGVKQSLRDGFVHPRDGSRRRNSLQALTEAFLHFLEHGSLPWWFQLPAGKELEQVLLECWLGGNLNDATVTVLEETLIPLREEQAISRLLLQFSENFCSLLLPMIAPQVGMRLGAVLERLTSLALPAAALEQIREKVWRQAFGAAAHHTAVTEHDLISRAFPELPRPVKGRPEVVAALERHWPGATTSAKADTQKKRKSRAPSVRGELPAPPKQAADQSQRDDSDADGIYIENGGVVLLHPYLQRLFEELKVCRGDRIIHPERGVALLQYLASGSLDQPEYRLALAKVLCNIPLHATLARNAGLTERDVEMCDSLLAALLAHWGALRNSSADGLRGSFLMRPAKLALRGNDEWLLQVEKNSYDILLDQLPYSISMVKLPWMPRLLWVEWN